MEKSVKPMETGLYILYTDNIAGNLEMLPRLHTFLKQMKALPLDEGDDVMVCAVQPVARPTLLLDLGNSCSPEVWHCAATGGRSMLIVMDAMGYRAANVSGMLTADARERLRENILSLALVDEVTACEDNDVLITLNGEKSGGDSAAFQIVLAPSTSTHLEGNTLFLAPVQAGQVGAVHISSGYSPVIQAHTVFDLPSATPPDPTISATVEFVLNEARLYQRKNPI
jgi:hypothetical protein